MTGCRAATEAYGFDAKHLVRNRALPAGCGTVSRLLLAFR